MDLTFSEHDEAFREEVRAFFHEHLTDDMRRTAARTTTVFADRDLALRWQRILVDKGWAVPAWPSPTSSSTSSVPTTPAQPPSMEWLLAVEHPSQPVATMASAISRGPTKRG